MHELGPERVALAPCPESLMTSLGARPCLPGHRRLGACASSIQQGTIDALAVLGEPWNPYSYATAIAGRFRSESLLSLLWNAHRGITAGNLKTAMYPVAALSEQRGTVVEVTGLLNV